MNGLIEKKMISEKIMDGDSIIVQLSYDEIVVLQQHWKMIWDLKKILK